MGCHPKALARFAENIRQHPGSVDYWLDEWFDVTTRATPWDADQWGFKHDWMTEERAELSKRADHKAWPKEVV